MALALEYGTPVNLSASGIVSKASGGLLGFYVNSTNAGTIVLRDGTLAGSSAITGTITPAIGWREFPAEMPNGCYATIGGVALDVTFIFAAT